MKNFFFILSFLILPILAGTWAMTNFFIPESNSPFDTGVGYFFLAVVITYAGRKVAKKYGNKFFKSSIIIAIAPLVYAIMIWSEIIHSPNNFIDGLGHLLFGLILFLSHHKRIASIVTTQGKKKCIT